MKEIAQFARGICGLKITHAQLASLEIYERELLEWNERYNLTAITDPEKVRIKHFLDSLTCLCVMRDSTMERVIDVGTGAGFPGLPIKIINPSIQLTLVDSVGKKTRFCEHIVKTLNIEGVEVVRERAEVIGHQQSMRQQFDWALARAVAALPILAEYLLPLVRVGGSMLAMKGESVYTEAQSSERALQVLGGHLREIVPVTLPGVVEEHFLVIVDKISATPPNYPRRAGVPVKKPLKL